MDANIFKRKSVWIFDLDNTIYEPETNIFNQIDEKMKTFISEKIFITKDEALILQKKYYKKYGTTLFGLMKHHNIDPNEFLDYVHNIDLENLKTNPTLHKMIKALPGKKIIYTNGEKKYAKKVLYALGINDLFKDIWDIKSSKFVPKPQIDPLKNYLFENTFKAENCVYFEDLKKNLLPGHQLGLTTVHISNEASNESDFYIDFRFKTIISALDMINKNI
tara:strand:+ start:55 stop:714 length:660 start_codon:yes stop_codon:yes gene_type:complete